MNYRILCRHRQDMLRLGFLLLVVHCACPIGAVASGPSAAPNFVFILVDDLGWTDAACFGSHFYETPVIDGLKRQSMCFTNGYAACPVCSPTRASIQTGCYPARLGTTEWFGAPQPKDALEDEWRQVFQSRRLLPAKYVDHLPLEDETLAEMLRAAGYRTFFAGKWHLGGEGFLPEQRGYQVNIGGYEIGWPPGGYFSPYKNPRLADGPVGEHLPDRLARESIKFLKDANEQPFLLFLSFYSVHTPIEGRKDLVEKYRAKAEKLQESGPLFLPEGEHKNRQRQDDAVYAAMVESVDQAVGKLLDAIDRLGLHNNTIVFFISDNGGLSTAEGSPTSNLPLRAGKGWLYEGGIRVPWLVRWPGVVSPGTECDVQVITNDVFPTVREMAGISRRADNRIDGLSLVPLLQGKTAPDRDALYWHYPHYSNQGGSPGGAVREGPWKLIEWYEDGKLELYNLDRDVGELHNVSKEHPEITARLHRKLAEWRKSVGARMPTPNPIWHSAHADETPSQRKPSPNYQ